MAPDSAFGAVRAKAPTERTPEDAATVACHMAFHPPSWATGLTAVLAHAALRTQNFKARLASSRAEFQAMWQSQNAADYTL